MTVPRPGPSSRMRTAVSLTLITIGAVLLIGGPVIGILIASSTGLSSVLGDLKSQVRFSDEATVDTEVPGTFFIYSAQPVLPAEDACDVTLVDGGLVTVDAAPREQNSNVGWTRFESFARFELSGDSAADVTCGKQSGDLVVGPGFDDVTFPGDMFCWTFAGGSIIMAVGFASATVGIVKYPRRTDSSGKGQSFR